MLDKKFIDYVLEQCREIGIKDTRVYYENRKHTYLNIEDGETNVFRQADEEGIRLSGTYKGYFCSTYVEKLDRETANEAIQIMIEIAVENGEKGKNEKIEENRSIGEDRKVVLDRKYLKPFCSIDWSEVEKRLKGYQEEIKKLDKRIISVSKTALRQVWVQVSLFEENGNEMTESYEFFQGFVSLVVEDNGRKQDAYASDFKRSVEEIDYLEIGRRIFEEAEKLLLVKPIQTGDYKVLLSNNVAADLFSYFLPIFKQEEVDKGNSKFANMQGKEVASSVLTIYEDPSSSEAPVVRTFDDEGTTTGRKYFFEKGKLGAFINCSKDAKGKVLTGNGFCKNYKSPIGTIVRNTFIEAGKRSTKEILETEKRVLYITGLDGLFAGVNAKTGDFSVIAIGLLMEKGQVIQPVNQITIGGNFYQMVKDIKEVSSDRWQTDDWENYVKAPAILIRSLKVGGL